MANANDTMLVRLKPYNPRKGYVLRTYVDGRTGTTFREERGWYEVPAELAALLKDVHSRPEVAESPLAFDVCTRDEAVALEKRIRRESAQRASASDPLSVDAASTDNLTGRTLQDTLRRGRRNRGIPGTLTTADLNGTDEETDDLDPSNLSNYEEEGDEEDLESDDLAAQVQGHAQTKRGGVRGGVADNGLTPRRAGIKPGPGSIVPGVPTGGGGGTGEDVVVMPNVTTQKKTVNDPDTSLTGQAVTGQAGTAKNGNKPAKAPAGAPIKSTTDKGDVTSTDTSTPAAKDDAEKNGSLK